MATTGIKGDNEKLDALLRNVVKSMMSALEALAGKGLQATPGELTGMNGAQILESLDQQHVVVHGELDRDYGGQTVRFLIPACEATTLAGCMMMTPDDVIMAHREKCQLQGEDLETFGEVANIFCSGIDTILRENLPDEIVLRSRAHGIVEPTADQDDLLGSEPLVAFPFSMEIEGFARSQAMILLEPETATRWNGGSLDMDFGSDSTDGPAAPVRGRLAAYLADPDLLPDIRTVCRRVGLALERHIRTDIPNPAAHVGEIIMLDVPPGDSKRFEWCKRLKAFHDDIQVVLMVHHPSRSRVIQGFMAKADLIIGCPVSGEVLLQRLKALLDGDPQPEPGD